MTTKKIDADKQYRVKLKRVVKLGEGRTVLHPRNDNVIKGRVLETILDFVASYEEA